MIVLHVKHQKLLQCNTSNSAEFFCIDHAQTMFVDSVYNIRPSETVIIIMQPSLGTALIDALRPSVCPPSPASNFLLVGKP